MSAAPAGRYLSISLVKRSPWLRSILSHLVESRGMQRDRHAPQNRGDFFPIITRTCPRLPFRQPPDRGTAGPDAIADGSGPSAPRARPATAPSPRAPDLVTSTRSTIFTFAAPERPADFRKSTTTRPYRRRGYFKGCLPFGPMFVLLSALPIPYETLARVSGGLQAHRRTAPDRSA